MPDRSLFDGLDIVGVSFEATTLPNAALTDVDALRAIADELDTVFYTKKAEFGDVVRPAAEELLRLRVALNVAEKAARTLTRRLKAISKAAGDEAVMDLADQGAADE